MTFDELLPVVHSLPPSDKLRLIQLLAEDLLPASVESASALPEPGDYPLWSPYHSFEAAAGLLNALDADASAR